jgi:hypothetical protein
MEEWRKTRGWLAYCEGRGVGVRWVWGPDRVVGCKVLTSPFCMGREPAKFMDNRSRETLGRGHRPTKDARETSTARLGGVGAVGEVLL